MFVCSSVVCAIVRLFLFKQKTAYEMRISDWSSDVCSSDLVEIENIVRHLRMGKKPIDAARDAAAEIGTAVIATSLTLAAVFVPVAFMPGIAGKFFRAFGWTAATAVMFPVLVARMLHPMMAAYLLNPPGEDNHESEPLAWYPGPVAADRPPP